MFLRTLRRSSSRAIPRVYAQFNSNAVTIGHRRLLSTSEYHRLADYTLESITDSYECLIENIPEIDVDLSQGVLTLAVPSIGTYVLNKQPPNLQIWLSSPISGPKRFDYDEKNKKWVYSRDSSTLGATLKGEAKEALGIELDLDIE